MLEIYKVLWLSFDHQLQEQVRVQEVSIYSQEEQMNGKGLQLEGRESW